MWVFPVGGGIQGVKRGGGMLGIREMGFYMYAKMGFQNRDSALDTLS